MKTTLGTSVISHLNVSLMVQEEGMRVGVPVRPERLVDQLAALSHTNLKDDASKVQVAVIPEAASKEGSSSM